MFTLDSPAHNWWGACLSLVLKPQLHIPPSQTVPNWRQQGSCVLVYVSHSFCTWIWQTLWHGSTQDTLPPAPPRGSGTWVLWLMLSGWLGVSKNMSLWLPSLPLEAQPRNSGSHSSSGRRVLDLGLLNFPLNKAICPRTLGFCRPLVHGQFSFHHIQGWGASEFPLNPPNQSLLSTPTFLFLLVPYCP